MIGKTESTADPGQIPVIGPDPFTQKLQAKRSPGDFFINSQKILKSQPDYWPAGNLYDTPGIKHASPSQLPGLADGLLRLGFDETEIRGILGGNFRRVAAAVWAAGTS